MKHLCLVYMEPGGLDRLTAEERERLDRDSLAYDRELARRGHFIAASALQPTRTARTVRRGTLLDGPFAETKEVLVGFIFLDAADMEEAIRLAADIPMAKYAAIEVRPEFDF
ncbi:YciI family protein [Phenylobacterium sp. J367]|uniref:YciI family protein n=1 Tax=Phenylobacterium sp. J367 TaxID=2898435 RepID=UPI0021516BF3|nr:YciI family protein [Phenylobacterium sp. J367]MCR5880385.1 YciI family protein [Phenylobacterium sp. J367]